MVQHQGMLQPGVSMATGKMLRLRCISVPSGVAGDEVMRPEHPRGAEGTPPGPVAPPGPHSRGFRGASGEG